MRKQKRPNGAGTIKQRPNGKYLASITIGYDDDGRQKTRSLGTFNTYEQALEELNNYYANNKNIDKDKREYTFEDVFLKAMAWNDDDYSKRGYSKTKSMEDYRFAYSVLAKFKDKTFSTIRFEKIIDEIEKAQKGAPTNKKIKYMLSIMYRYANRKRIINENPVIDYMYWRSIPLKSKSNIHKTFLSNEIERIFENKVDTEIRDIIKFLLYTGVRINEFFNLKKSDVIWGDYYRAIVIREEISKNHTKREIPLHEDIQRIVWNALIKEGSDYLFTTDDNKPYGYTNFQRTYWNPFMRTRGIEMQHLIHDTRYTFKTFANKYMDERIVEAIMGHSSESEMADLYNDIKKDDPTVESKDYIYDEMQKLTFKSNNNKRKKLQDFSIDESNNEVK